MSTKYYVMSATNGCVTSLLEISKLRKTFGQQQIEITDSPESADVIILSTCGYNQAAEDHSIHAVEELERKYKGKRIIVGGCLPTIQDGALAGKFSDQVQIIKNWNEIGQPSVWISSPMDQRDLRSLRFSNRLMLSSRPLLGCLERFLGFRPQPLYSIIESHAFDERAYFVEVSKGCRGHCTYCAITKVKGELQSRPLAEILQSVKEGLTNGYRTFHLTGDDVGCWGQDIGTHVAELLKAILRIPGNYSLVITYFDPGWLARLFVELKEPLSDPRLICVNFPVQTGSPQLARKMGRGGKLEEVLATIKQVRALNPGLVLKTHLMTGFPTETTEQFRQTLATLASFDLIFPNSFSPRPHTAAAVMTGQISSGIKFYRYYHLKLRILLRHAGVFLASFSNRLNSS
ncbi:MAG TPA: hypothetical protein DCS07_07395 [Bdellovibrionales bacterium]|nr:MAG: hypothetical protein A2Z97_06900 [Bdellovibrionales bacterium GWB1_52_6]OFZ05465.1 MAG: hypothetical protein A2X97_11350 [Bdellovibrionales bacterium GWA1_52_35]OFZ40449.1 MAG: hypothetical protein A2070_07430 [Bdellovibrionales bacterium GWC1_52_8]HAR42443.1 hypothetical protein [Bdellovibrionales bacterium]HCM39171.1 hypothetical protein [Bdellovibrionales bacterium]